MHVAIVVQAVYLQHRSTSINVCQHQVRQSEFGVDTKCARARDVIPPLTSGDSPSGFHYNSVLPPWQHMESVMAQSAFMSLVLQQVITRVELN